MDLLAINVPVLVRVRRGSSPEARPLFAPHERWTSRPTLEQTLQALRREIARDFSDELRGDDHRQLAEQVRFADVELTRWRGTIALREGTLHCTIGIARFPALGGEVCFVLDERGVWFHVRVGESFETRAAEVLEEHFRRVENAEPDAIPASHRIESKGRVWLEELVVQVPNRHGRSDDDDERRAGLFASKPFDGFFELLDRGERLDDLYPDSLHGCLGRESEAEVLRALLDADDRRPVLIVGEQDAGKTALLHEALRRSIEQKTADRSGPYRAGRQRTFLLSPQRLIAGMMYVGQWEGRLRSILQHASTWRHTLVFENLLGLFQAGRSSRSETCFADLLRPWLAKREVRFVSETTPEGLRILRERDRGFADLFQIVRVRPFARAETMQLLVQLRRESEDAHGLAIESDVLTTIGRYCEHYLPDAAFPGKAVRLLRDVVRDNLSAKLSSESEDRDGKEDAAGPDNKPPPIDDPLKLQLARNVQHADVLRAFAARTGYRFDFLDREARVTRSGLIEQLAARVRGQPAALDAAADAVLMARARLADPGRPLASMLFVGPTGVGKTETAKAVAAVVFDDPERFLRFDLNEFATSDSVPRLFGTFDKPDGLLTGAVRRQPSCVLLLDEIEKAHPDVFDLLLQVLGEGRLTDAHGRTVSFQHVLIFMTSNLGVKEAEAGLGFGAGARAGDAHFIKAAESFFRPEFFNRIDRVVPFGPLAHAEVETIARGLLERVLTRHGVRRRQCLIDLEPGFASWLAEGVSGSRFGARALKRLVEARIVQPIADQLAAVKFETPVFVRFGMPSGGACEPSIAVEALQQCHPGPERYARIGTLSEAARVSMLIEFAHKLRGRVAELDVGQRSSDTAPSERQVAIWRIQEKLTEVISRLDEWDTTRDERGTQRDVSKIRVSMSRGGGLVGAAKRYHFPRPSLLREVCQADDVDEFLKSHFATQHAEDRALNASKMMIAKLARIASEVEALARREPSQSVRLHWRWVGWRDERLSAWLLQTITLVVQDEPSDPVAFPVTGGVADGVIEVVGLRPTELSALVEGRHLIYSAGGELGMLEVAPAGVTASEGFALPVVSLIRVTRSGCQVSFLGSGEAHAARSVDTAGARLAAEAFLHLMREAPGLEETIHSSHG